MLVYPRPTSDAQGQITLPTFESLYRLTDPALPPGVEPPLHPRALTLLPQAPLIETSPTGFHRPTVSADSTMPSSNRMSSGLCQRIHIASTPIKPDPPIGYHLCFPDPKHAKSLPMTAPGSTAPTEVSSQATARVTRFEVRTTPASARPPRQPRDGAGG